MHDTLDNAVETFVYRDGLNPVAWQRVVGSGTPVRAYFGYGLQAHTPEIMWVDNDGVARPPSTGTFHGRHGSGCAAAINGGLEAAP